MYRCIVDRNTVAADRIRDMLNRLLASVRTALLDETSRGTYESRINRTLNLAPDFFNWIHDLPADSGFSDFFTDFAGQGRIRWHYGVAHPLLCSFEKSFMAEDGRGWLADANRARELVRIFGRCYPILLVLRLSRQTCSGSLGI